MNSSLECLRPEQVRSILENELPPAELASLEEHLSSCRECRTRLDRASGDPEWWPEARESLIAMFPPDGDADARADASGEVSDTCHADVLRLLGPTDDPRMLGRIGPYEIAGILGRGGMGVVFKGFDTALNRYVAIKMLLPHLAATGAARRRFAREAQAAAAVVDDHVMPIHVVSEWQGRPYLVMPYTRGVSLQRRLADQGALDVREVLRIGMQTARALAAAHAQGLVHRDVTPANIMLAEGVERVLLTDFGLARAADDAALTLTGVPASTPQYMSPEQVRGQQGDARSDLFSLGSVLYACCTGRAPFRAESSYGVLRMITDAAPCPIQEINPDIPAWLSGIIEKLMAKPPEERFTSAKEVADLLEACLAHVQQPTRTPLPTAAKLASRTQPKPTKLRLTGRMLTMLTALIAIVIGVAGYQNTAPPDIGGEWTGDEWGKVILKQTADGDYTGTYTDTSGKQPGEIRLKWSRIEQRFHGTWREGEDRFGEVSVRLVDKEIRGALTTDRASKVNPGTPRLADLSWKRAGDAGPAPVSARDERPKVPPPAAIEPPATSRIEPATARSRPSNVAPAVPADPTAGMMSVPPRRIQRFQTTDAVTTIAYSPDAAFIAVASGRFTAPGAGDWKRKIELLDAKTGKLIRSFKATTDEEDALLDATEGLPDFGVGPLAISRDGNLLAVGTGIGLVRLFDVQTGDVILTLDDEQAKQADKKTPAKLKALKRAMGSVGSLAFSPDGASLAIAGSSFDDVASRWGGRSPLGRRTAGPGRLKVWDVKTGKLKFDLAGHGQVFAIAYSPDGSAVASAGYWTENGSPGNGAILWDANTGKKMNVMNHQGNGGTHAIAFSADSKRVVTGTLIFDKENDTSTTAISVAYSKSGIMEWQRMFSRVMPVAFSPDGNSILALSNDNNVQILNAKTGQVMSEIRGGAPAEVGRWNCCVLVPHGRVLVIGGDSREKGGFVEIWDLGGTPVREPATGGRR
jgi:serine/threonine protein kinase/WD40 repeat protein